jgi:flagellar basal body rod protein FlgG
VTTDPTAGPLGPNGQQESNVDLVTQIVALSKAKELYTANAIVLRTADRTLGTLLDVVAGR